MTKATSFGRQFSKVLRHWTNKEYDVALSEVETLQRSWPGNAQLQILWANLVQLQDKTEHSLDDAKNALKRAIELDERAPAASIELGHFLGAVEDDPRAAAKAFSAGVAISRALLIEGLLGQASAHVELDERKDAIACLVEAIYLSQSTATPNGKQQTATSDLLLRDPFMGLRVMQLKGPFAAKIDELLDDLAPRRSA